MEFFFSNRKINTLTCFVVDLLKNEFNWGDNFNDLSK